MKDEIVETASFAVLMFILAAIVIAFEVLFGTITWLSGILLPDVEPILAAVAMTFFLLAVIVIIFMMLSANRKWK